MVRFGSLLLLVSLVATAAAASAPLTVTDSLRLHQRAERLQLPDSVVALLEPQGTGEGGPTGLPMAAPMQPAAGLPLERVGGGLWAQSDESVFSEDKLYRVYAQGLQIVDIDEPGGPVILSQLYLPHLNSYRAVAKYDSYVYVLDMDSGLTIANVANPQAPTVVKRLPDYKGMRIKISGFHAYLELASLTCEPSSTKLNPLGCHVLDLTDPENPVLAMDFSEVRDFGDVVEDGSFVYMMTNTGLRVAYWMAPDLLAMVGGPVPLPADVPGFSFFGDMTKQANFLYASDDRGFAVVDVSDPSWPQFISSLQTDYMSTTMALSGSYAYVSGYRGIGLIDVSNPATLMMDTINEDWGGYSMHVATVRDQHLYVADDQLRVFDISNPTQPVLEHTALSGSECYFMGVDGRYAYVTVPWQGIRIVDLVNPREPTQVGYFARNGYPMDFEFSGNLMLTANYYGKLVIFDRSNPSELRQIGELDWWPLPGEPNDMAITGDHAYVAAGAGGLVVVDFSTPERPRVAATVSEVSNPRYVTVAGTYAYVSNSYDSIVVLDIQQPLSPQVVALIPASITGGVWVDGKVGCFTSYGGASHTYVAILDLTNPHEPRITGYYSGDYGSAVDRAVMLALRGGHMYVQESGGTECYRHNDIVRINVSDPEAPYVEARLPVSTAEWIHTAIVSDNYLYLAGGNELEVINGAECCFGRRGDINGRPPVDLADLSRLISYLISGTSLPCSAAADVNGIGTIDLADLSAMIAYLLTGINTLGFCPE